jgi:hypothetical protein
MNSMKGNGCQTILQWHEMCENLFNTEKWSWELLFFTSKENILIKAKGARKGHRHQDTESIQRTPGIILGQKELTINFLQQSLKIHTHIYSMGCNTVSASTNCSFQRESTCKSFSWWKCLLEDSAASSVTGTFW